jgi:hypothetical protein
LIDRLRSPEYCRGNNFDGKATFEALIIRVGFKGELSGAIALRPPQNGNIIHRVLTS